MSATAAHAVFEELTETLNCAVLRCYREQRMISKQTQAKQKKNDQDPNKQKKQQREAERHKT